LLSREFKPWVLKYAPGASPCVRAGPRPMSSAPRALPPQLSPSPSPDQHTPSLCIIFATMDSPASDLSDYASDDFPEDVKGRPRSMEQTPDHDHRPNKRLRLNHRAPSSPPPHNPIPPLEDDGELSEDTDGSVPASPNHHPGMSQDLDEFGQDQVTVCKWEGCEAGDLENMDELVNHLHDDHIGTRQKRYSCEWSDCTRKGIPHASGYALRAHMRSHTREKPFYCTLPGSFAFTHSFIHVKLTMCL
jgi:hypothetical protein